MSNKKWIIFGISLGLIVATACFLGKIRNVQRLGPPGVRLGAVSVYDERGNLVSTNSVVLPDEVLGGRATNVPIRTVEVNGLPRDTTFGRHTYRLPDGFEAAISVVLMGADRTSIHDPHFCLVGQGWTILQTKRVPIRIERPFAYDIPAVKLTTTIVFKDAAGQTNTLHGIYIYWFVSGENITGDQGERLWSIARTMMTKGFLERWAYITYFATCVPGQEQATSRRLEEFIRASAPEFQTVTGQPAGGVSVVIPDKTSPK